MAWHVMMVLEDVRDGQWGDILHSVGGGYAVLDDEQYAAWQRAPLREREVQARKLRDGGGWKRRTPTWGGNLASLHRVAASLDDAEAVEGLPVDDTDRFFNWYWMLEPASVAFFEAHLRRDTATERALAGLQALDRVVDTGDGNAIAGCAAMFARAGNVVGRRGGADFDTPDFDTPDKVPGPLPADVIAALGDWTGADADLSDADDWPEDERVAATLVYLAFAGFPALTKTPTWVRATLRRLEIEGLGAGMAAARKAIRLDAADHSWIGW